MSNPLRWDGRRRNCSAESRFNLPKRAERCEPLPADCWHCAGTTLRNTATRVGCNPRPAILYPPDRTFRSLPERELRLVATGWGTKQPATIAAVAIAETVLSMAPTPVGQPYVVRRTRRSLGVVATPPSGWNFACRRKSFFDPHHKPGDSSKILINKDKIRCADDGVSILGYARMPSHCNSRCAPRMKSISTVSWSLRKNGLRNSFSVLEIR